MRMQAARVRHGFQRTRSHTKPPLFWNPVPLAVILLSVMRATRCCTLAAGDARQS